MKIYCSGIGGIGLSAYAALEHARGHEVSGSDRAANETIRDLESQGIAVHLSQDGSHVPRDANLFVYSEAVPKDAPERKKAAEYGIRQLSYFGALGEASKSYKLIGVCGTHGKSSTTAMAARFLLQAGFDPTIIIGTKLGELNGRNWRLGKSDFFLAEACEYRRSFLFLEPSIILMTNCDGDHFDYYRDSADYKKAFVEFIRKLPDGGMLITHMADKDCKAVAESCGVRVVDADELPLPELKTPGLHMQKNGQLVLALASALGIDADVCREALSGYAGSWRRTEVVGTVLNSVTVIDDYGHHPLEVRSTLEAIRDAYAPRRIVCAFQPHTHNRTLALYNDFTTSFSACDALVLLPVYDARSDTESETVDLEKFAKNISTASKTTVQTTASLDQASAALLDSVLQQGDVLVCMGAGSITNLARSIVSH